ncbi:phosphatase PAP2 family protein [Proteiniclasticum sp.]|uniref:phosphatase PAP2 family protein n=1 Tax=Proteiniclasticum sp. TaxID=2053595 RepID=UPI0028971139|nr:phosphatase PAP2 family protein [Proteiniclasticum sp.]
MIDKIKNWDERIVIYINQRVKRTYLDYFFTAATYLGSDIFAIGFILAFTILPMSRIDDFARYAAVALIMSSVTVGIMKNKIRRKRPFESIIELKSLKIGVDQFSFPSGHTTAAFCLAVTSALVTEGHIASTVYLVLALIVAISRVYLGVHYPSDVIAGGVIGTFYAILVNILREVLINV